MENPEIITIVRWPNGDISVQPDEGMSLDTVISLLHQADLMAARPPVVLDVLEDSDGEYDLVEGEDDAER